MKKIVITLLLIASIGGYAQITLEHQYLNGNWFPQGYMKVIRLSSSGDKYVTYDSSAITLYNLNHTLFRTINMPTITYPASFLVWYISEELFNTNPADIEFLVYGGVNGYNGFNVYDETGTILFSKDSAGISNSNSENNWGSAGCVYYTTNGYKMIISTPGYTGQHYVYSLPGFLPCHDCNNGVVTGMGTENSELKNGNITNYPNPNKGETTIEYSLPQGTTKADLVFYSMQGQEVKRFKVTDAFHTIVISTADLDAGTYYYEIQTAGGYKAGKKMVVVK